MLLASGCLAVESLLHPIDGLWPSLRQAEQAAPIFLAKADQFGNIYLLFRVLRVGIPSWLARFF
jgi:hypothetical protein